MDKRLYCEVVDLFDPVRVNTIMNGKPVHRLSLTGFKCAYQNSEAIKRMRGRERKRETWWARMC